MWGQFTIPAGIRDRLTRVGLYRESGNEHFNGSLIVPVTDAHGNVVEIYGRKLLDNLRTGTPKHLYLPGCAERGRGVFNLDALAASKEIILTEALIDALTFWCAGYRNVTSSYGIEGFTGEHVAAFKQHGTERVLIAYDRDEAGERGSQKVAERLMTEGIEAWRLQFPKGMDANAYALKVTPAAKSLGVVIRKALWLGKGTPPQRCAVEPVVEVAVDEAANPISSLAAKEKIAALPAAVPPAPAPDTVAQVSDQEIVLVFGDGSAARRYRVRGLAKNLSYASLKVNLLVSQGEAFFVDTLDLYAARARAAFVAQAAAELHVGENMLKIDLGRVLLSLEQQQDAQIKQALTPTPAPAAAMAEHARAEALELLQSPGLMDRILADFDACGLMGERTNKLVAYLAAVSRRLDRPLGVVIQSSSAAGKSSLMDAVLAFVPDEEKVKYSAMTGQSLFYMGETNLKHKALAIVEEEGASRADAQARRLHTERGSALLVRRVLERPEKAHRDCLHGILCEQPGRCSYVLLG